MLDEHNASFNRKQLNFTVPGSKPCQLFCCCCFFLSQLHPNTSTVLTIIIPSLPPKKNLILLLFTETCRCYKRLTSSWYEFRPYVQLSENGPEGLIPPILRKLTVTCCETCQSHGTSYVDLNSNGFNQSAKLPNLRTLKTSIANPTDFFFPVYGFKEQTHFAKMFGYQGIVESPGMAYIVNTNSHDDMPNAILTNIAACWPAITLALVITYLAGLVVWLVVSQTRCNQ